jgi:hypothetical protein
VSEPGAGSGAEAIVHDYFARLERALAPLPKDRRQQILDDLRDHVTTALAEGTPASQVLAALGTPEDIANEAYASGPTRPAKRAWRPRRLQLRYTVALAALVVALAGGTVGFAVTSDTAAQHPAKSASELTAHVADANSTCSPTWVASASGGPASVLTSTATEVASGTTGGQAWTLWSAKRETGAQGIENGGLVISGRAYGLCPGYPNPAELELADIAGGHGLAFGVVGYPGLAKVWLYKSTTGTFDTGKQLPAPDVRVVDGVSFFIGTLPQSACDYPSLELNTTSPGVSDEHNLGFGRCTLGQLVPISASQGIWQLPPGHFVSNFPNSPGSGPGTANVPLANSTCSPATEASASGGPASTLTSAATKVASGTTGGQGWTLWSKKGQTGAQGIEDGGLVISGRAYGLCPGYPNPAELELADTSRHGLVYGVVGYQGLAKVWLYKSTTGTFDAGQRLPAPDVRVVDGVSFFIGALPQSACDYPSLELNATSPGVSDEHNLGFGRCTTGQLVPITASQGIWQLPPGHFVSNFPNSPGSGPGTGTANVPLANSTCSPATEASASGGPASALTSAATEVASGTAGGQAWTLWSKKGQTGAQGIEDGGLVISGRAYGLCPGFPNPAELELADTAGGHGLAFGVVGYHGLAKIWLYKSTTGTFDTGQALPAPQVKVVDGVSFFIGALPQSACDYPSLELNATSPGVSDEHNLGFGRCTTGQLVPITASQGIWQLPPGQFPKNF